MDRGRDPLGCSAGLEPGAQRIRWRGDPGRGTPPPPPTEDRAGGLAITYLTIAEDGAAEIEVSRSRFRCALVRVEDEMSARGVIEQVRKENWDARHHCSA